MSIWKRGLAIGTAALSLLPGLAGTAQPAQAASDTTITFIGMSDYHSHAIPFYSEGQPDQAGVARTLAYLKTARANTPNLLVLSGGDTMNKGTPSWSDEYHCAEWPWFNGLIDAMALGNHEFDYGQDVFKGCQAGANYPVISSNYVGADGQPLLNTAAGKPYFVKEVGGVRIGAFALAGTDFDKLIPAANRATGATFADRVATARATIATLRDTEKVQAVVLFGHASREDDTALAQAVPGIDLILGSHSHLKGELSKIPNTATYYISPFQYLTYLSQVDMTFSDGKLTKVGGNLVKMDAAKPVDAQYGPQVAQMQTALEAKRPERFKVLGQAAGELNVEDLNNNETTLGNWSMEVVRKKAGAYAFFSTTSSFRAAIAPGPVTVEGFFTAIPYKNSIVTADMSGQQLLDLLNLAVSKRGSDSFLQESGVRFAISNGSATNVQVAADPAATPLTYVALDLGKTYKIGVTNFMSGVAAGYKDLIAKAANVTDTKVDIGTVLTDAITAGPISGQLDGRMSNTAPAVPTAVPAPPTAVPAPPTAAPAPPTTVPVIAPPPAPIPDPAAPPPNPAPGMPTTGAPNATPWAALVAALTLLALGGMARRRRT